MGSSAEGIYDNQYSLAGSILDVLLEEQADTLQPSAVMNAEKLEAELQQKDTGEDDPQTGVYSVSSTTSRLSMVSLDSPFITGLFLFVLGFLLAQSFSKINL
jgi:hypothetical protein